jgi:hypothetical protein
MLSKHEKFTAIILSLVLVFSLVAESRTSKDRSGLIGAVETIVTESGTWLSGSSVLLEARKFDEKGNVTEYKGTFYDAEIKERKGALTTTYELDSSGNPTAAMAFGISGELQETRRYVYDRRGNLVELALYDKNDNLKSKQIHAYDHKGNIIETKFRGHDGSLVSIAVYAYDSNGNNTSMSFYMPCVSQQDCKLEHKTGYVYERGKRIEARIYTPDGKLNERSVFRYNPIGQEQETTVYNPDGSIRDKETYAYEYDSVGNWTKKTITNKVNKEGKLVLDPPYVIKRTITYYK